MKKQKIIIGRDYCGKVPLHFCNDKNEETWFSSEKKGLMNQVENTEEIFDFPVGKYYIIDKVRNSKLVKTIPNNPLQHPFPKISSWTKEEIQTKLCIARAYNFFLNADQRYFLSRNAPLKFGSS